MRKTVISEDDGDWGDVRDEDDGDWGDVRNEDDGDDEDAGRFDWSSMIEQVLAKGWGRKWAKSEVKKSSYFFSRHYYFISQRLSQSSLPRTPFYSNHCLRRPIIFPTLLNPAISISLPTVILFPEAQGSV